MKQFADTTITPSDITPTPTLIYIAIGLVVIFGVMVLRDWVLSKRKY